MKVLVILVVALLIVLGLASAGLCIVTDDYEDILEKVDQNTKDENNVIKVHFKEED